MSFTKAAAWLAGGIIGGKILGTLADSSTDPTARFLLRAGSMAAYYKGIQGAGVNVLGGLEYRAARSQAIAARAEAAALRPGPISGGHWAPGELVAQRSASSLVEPTVLSIPKGARPGPRSILPIGYQKATSLASKAGSYGAAASYGSMKNTVAGWGFRGALGLVGKASGWAAKEVGSGLVGIPAGTYEYGKLAVNSFGKGRGAFFAGMGAMKHAEAPLFALGAAAGIWSANANRGDYHRGPIAPPGLWGGQPPVNMENFRGGIAMGRSAIASPIVMSGQAVVTNRMLKRKRV